MNSKSNKNLIIITEYYPFSAVAEVFLDLEIPYLSKVFNSIVIVPRLLPEEAERVERQLPANISVDTSLVGQKIRRSLSEAINIAINAGKSKYLYSEIFRRPTILQDITSVKKTVCYLYEALRVRNWILRYIEQNNVDLTKTIFYTYWMDSATTGIGMVKHEYNELKLVSRSHGRDLYEERHLPPYIPFRVTTLQQLDHVYLISEHGKTYSSERYPYFKSKFIASHLGVRATGFKSEASLDGVLRVVSCSYTTTVKRIHLIIFGLKELGLSRPELEIEWVHIGHGPLQEKIKNCAASQLPKNVVSKFLGFMPNSEVLLYYKHNPVDVFINTSASEGIPVSIMEAQSCGIPVIATAVGGNPEIVLKDVGILISENPSPKEIADALKFFVDHPDDARQLRLNSLINWDNHYNASKNFTNFVNTLKEV